MKRGMRFLAWIALGMVAVFVFGITTMFLWNALIPDLFGGPVISFWQALGLVVLSKILFFAGGGQRCGCSHNMGPGRYWKGKFYNKFASMPPEEREALKQKMKEKWCHWDENVSTKDSTASND